MKASGERGAAARAVAACDSWKRMFLIVKFRGDAFSADLGDSSKYKSEILLDRSGAWFFNKCVSLKVSRFVNFWVSSR